MFNFVLISLLQSFRFLKSEAKKIYKSYSFFGKIEKKKQRLAKMLLKGFYVSGHIVTPYLRSQKLETAVIHK